MVAQRRPFVGRVAETEVTDRRVGEHSAAQIVASSLSLGRHQRAVKETRRLAVRLEHPSAQIAQGIIVGILGHIQPDALREILDRVDIVEVLDLHNKRNHVARRAAAEAVKGVGFRVDIEGRRFLAVKRTQTDHVPAAPLERDVGGNDFRNIVSGFQLVNEPLGKCHKTAPFPISTYSIRRFSAFPFIFLKKIL